MFFQYLGCCVKLTVDGSCSGSAKIQFLTSQFKVKSTHSGHENWITAIHQNHLISCAHSTVQTGLDALFLCPENFGVGRIQIKMGAALVKAP
jgi:hypothetical protein